MEQKKYDLSDLDDLLSDSDEQYMLLVDEPSRAVILKALTEFIDRNVGSSVISADELQTAMDMQDMLSTPETLP